MKPNKYRAKAIWHCRDCDTPYEKPQPGTKNCPYCHGSGEHFHSKGEHARWCVLKIDPAVSGLRRQVRYPLAVDGHPLLTDTGRQIVYVADFVYRFKHESFVQCDRSSGVVEDFKGYDTPVSKLKRAIFTAQYRKKVLLSGLGVPMRGRIAA